MHREDISRHLDFRSGNKAAGAIIALVILTAPVSLVAIGITYGVLRLKEHREEKAHSRYQPHFFQPSLPAPTDENLRDSMQRTVIRGIPG